LSSADDGGAAEAEFRRVIPTYFTALDKARAGRREGALVMFVDPDDRALKSGVATLVSGVSFDDVLSRKVDLDPIVNAGIVLMQATAQMFVEFSNAELSKTAWVRAGIKSFVHGAREGHEQFEAWKKRWGVDWFEKVLELSK
jgi:hypothetical protein